MTYPISGIILAGGSGKRFNGATKSNIVIAGKTILSRIVDTISGLFNEIIIVTNTPDEFKGHNNCKIVSDQYLNAGPLGGIHAALKASSNKAVFVFAGDMPLLNKSVIIRQIKYYLSSKCDVLIPRTGNNLEPLHSICNISILKTLEEYLEVDQDYAVRDFFNKMDVRYLQCDEMEETRNAFKNINFPSDIPYVESIILGL